MVFVLSLEVIRVLDGIVWGLTFSRVFLGIFFRDLGNISLEFYR